MQCNWNPDGVATGVAVRFKLGHHRRDQLYTASHRTASASNRQRRLRHNLCDRLAPVAQICDASCTAHHWHCGESLAEQSRYTAPQQGQQVFAAHRSEASPFEGWHHRCQRGHSSCLNNTSLHKRLYESRTGAHRSSAPAAAAPPPALETRPAVHLPAP